MQNPDQTLINLVGLCLLLLPIPTIHVMWSARELAITRSLNEYGEVTEGLITYRTKAPFGFAGLISYQYSAPNKHSIMQRFHHRRQAITSSTYEGLEDQSQVIVSYLPKHPQVSRLAEEDVDHYTRNYTCYQAGCMMIFCPPLLFVWVFAYYISLAIYRHPNA